MRHHRRFGAAIVLILGYAAFLGSEATPADEAVAQDRSFPTAETIKTVLRKGHPRLWLTPERLALIRGKAAGNDPAWQIVKERADEAVVAGGAGGGEGEDGVLNLIAAYKATGDRKYAEAMIKRFRLRAKQPPLEGNGYRHAGTYYPLAYDWIADEMTPEDRAEAVRMLNSWIDNDMEHAAPKGTWTATADSDASTGHPMGYLTTALATWEENPRAAEIIGFIDKSGMWQTIRRYVSWSRGGTWIEGMAYSGSTRRYLLWGLECLRTATGIDLWKQPGMEGFPREVALEVIYSTTPGQEGMVPSGDIELGGYRFRHNTYQDLSVTLSQVLGNEETGKLIRHYINTVHPVLERHGAAEDLLCRDRSAPAEDYTKKLPLAYFAPGQGFLFTRSSWEKDATFACFQSGGPTGVDHQHGDANTFQVYRKGVWLTREVSGYSGPADDTAAHNGLLIDGKGQRPFHSSVPDARTLAVSTGKGYAYAKGDAAGPYNLRQYSNNPESPLIFRVPLAERAFAHLHPDTFVVLDRVEAGKPEDKKEWVLHAEEKPEVQGERLVLSAPDQRLVVTRLLPAEADVQVVDEKQLYAKALDYMIGENNKHWQVRVSPKQPAAYDVFLHVLQASDVAKPKSAPVKLGAEGQALAVAVDGWVFVGSLSPQPLATTSYTVPKDVVVRRHLITDLEPGTTVLVSSENKPVAEGKADSGGVFAFDGGSGVFLVTSRRAP